MLDEQGGKGDGVIQVLFEDTVITSAIKACPRCFGIKLHCVSYWKSHIEMLVPLQSQVGCSVGPEKQKQICPAGCQAAGWNAVWNKCTMDSGSR